MTPEERKAQMIRDLLTHSRIPWTHFEALGGSIERAEREAILHGDHNLAARAARALQRRGR
jgi:hypothetical protein